MAKSFSSASASSASHARLYDSNGNPIKSLITLFDNRRYNDVARQTFCISMDALCIACVAMESGGSSSGGVDEDGDGEGREEGWR